MSAYKIDEALIGAPKRIAAERAAGPTTTFAMYAGSNGCEHHILYRPIQGTSTFTKDLRL